MAPVIRECEISFRGYVTASVYVLVSGVVSLLSAVLYVIGYASAEWGYVNSGKTGLWQRCDESSTCVYVISRNLPAAHRATQACATIALLFIVLSVLLKLLYVIDERFQRLLSIAGILLTLHSVSCLMILVTLSLFGSRWRQQLDSIGYSVALSSVSLILEACCIVLLTLEVTVLSRTPIKEDVIQLT